MLRAGVVEIDLQIARLWRTSNQSACSPSGCMTCVMLLLVSRSSWCRLRSSHRALMPATTSTNSSASVDPHPLYGLTSLHQLSAACSNGTEF